MLELVTKSSFALLMIMRQQIIFGGGGLNAMELDGCFDHFIQLTTKIAHDDESLKVAVQHARALAGHFQNSNQATELLLKAQKSINSEVEPLRVIQDDITRWGSTYYKVDRILVLKIPIQTLTLQEKIPEYLTADDWERIAYVAKLLPPFKKLSDFLRVKSI